MSETACCPVTEGNGTFHKRPARQKEQESCWQLSLDLGEENTPDEGISLEKSLARSELQCRLLEEQLEQARKAAQSTEQAKTNFLNLMIHEVRTPMNGIIALVDLLKNSSPRDDQQEYIKGILASSDSLLYLINNIVDYSQLAAGDLALNSEPFSPQAAIEEASGPLLAMLTAKGLEHVCHIDDAIPAALRGDARRFRQIIGHLFSNAVKFTERGTIRLDLRLTEQCDTHVMLHLTIADSGIGIPSDFREKIFDPFVQVDVSSTRRCGGAGLGLSVARQLANLMGGTIWLETELGRGSRFHFRVPLTVDVRRETCERSAEKDQRSLLRWEGRSLHILLAEDHEVNRNLTERILRRLGHTVSAAHNGRNAVDISGKESFDLILMDMEMPEMDGWEATSAIRKREAAGDRHVPIIAVTAHAIKGNREMLLAAGFDGYMSKPIDFIALSREMKRLAST